MFGEAGVQSAAGGGGGGGGAQQVDLSDIFDSFFGGGGGGRGGFGGMGGAGAGARARQRGPTKGDDLRFDLEVEFDRAIFGGEEKAKIRHLESCETCKGDGLKPGTKKRGCGTCGGQGVVMQVTRTPLGNFQTQAACPTCRGTGEIIDEFCPKCSGQGTNQVAKTVTLTIPCGVENGQKLRVRGEGDAGPNGGSAGDLYIFINVKKDLRFRREGTEIYSDATVSYVDAILGSEAVVPTVDGDVTIKVPAGSQPETVLRLKGKGAPKLGAKDDRGNHYVTLKVTVPTALSAKEKALVEQLKALQK
jgi:molecular chaperone DnaJ